MELQWLEDCLALADTLNFSRAAERRHVTQPAYSRRIRSLEEWIGVPLFTRSRRSVQLTPAGEAFIRRASALTASIYAARREALEVAGASRPSLVFLATHVLSFTFFPAFIRRTGPGHGMGAYQLVSDTLKACEQLMLQGAAQFLLAHCHPRMRLGLDPAKFERVVVGHDVLKPFSAPSRQGERRPRWPVNGKKEIPLLMYSDDSGLGRIVAGHPGFRASRPRFTPAFTSDLAATLLAMCRSGQGIAWLPQTLVEDDIGSGRLVHAAAAAHGYDIEMDICLVRPREALAPHAEDMWSLLSAGRAAD